MLLHPTTLVVVNACMYANIAIQISLHIQFGIYSNYMHAFAKTFLNIRHGYYANKN